MSTTVSPLTEEISTDSAPDRRHLADLATLGSFALQAPVGAIGLRGPGGDWETVANGCQGGPDPVLGPLYDAIAERRYPVELPDLAVLPIGGSLDVIRWGYGVALRGPDGAVAAVVAVFDRGKREIGRSEQAALCLLSRRLFALLQLGGAVTSAAAASAVAWRECETKVPNPMPAPPPVPTTRALPNLMKTRDVAALFNVTDRTVLNWAERGHLPSVRTAGGHLRFHGPDVQHLLDATG